jgi:UDP-2,3-diacylglucosamine hydrolase
MQALDHLDVESALLFSDVHLNDRDPALTQSLLQWLDTQFPPAAAKPAPSALLILGDLFDWWLGDDSLGTTESATLVVSRLSQIAQQGVRVGLMHGNRDFLLGSVFANEINAFLMNDPFVLRVKSGMTIALTHGDELCTEDTAYQALRRQVRQPERQQQYLSKTLAERIAITAAVRGTSESEKSGKSMQIMDVTPAEAAALTDRLQADLLLHGHTHRPGCSTMPNGKPRWVLPDWSAQTGAAPRGGGLWVDALGIRPVPL